MWNWLNLNTGAVQGISAIIGLILTSGLIVVTWRYVRLTSSIAQTSGQQLAALLQPVVDLEITCEMFGSGGSEGRHWHTASGNFAVTNKGSYHIRLKQVVAVVQRGRNAERLDQRQFQLEGYENRVLVPQETLKERYLIESDTEFNKNFIYGLRVVCEDLPGLRRHEFVKHPEKGLRHSFVE